MVSIHSEEPTESSAIDAPNIRDKGSASYYIALALIIISIVITALLTKTERFGDYDTYTMYIDSLVHFPSFDWLKLEPLSNIYLWFCYWLTLNVIGANNIAHTILLAAFPLLLFISFSPTRTPWPAILAIFGLFGPLLVFVTLRATPAYLLATWAVYEASARRPKAFVLIALALGFHFSSIMAIPPLIILYFRDKLPAWAHFERPGIMLLLGFVIVAAAANFLAETALTYISAIPFLSKYVAYSATANENIETSVNHYIFLGISTGMLLAFLFLARGEASRLKIYVISSFLIYIALFIAASPVAAFRQTPFWILPLIGTFPWQRYVTSGPVAFLFVLACEAMFVLQINGVYT